MQADLFTIIKSPRGYAKVRALNLASFQERQAKCPGWTGKKLPAPRASKARGQMYRHESLGFSLWIPDYRIAPMRYSGAKNVITIGTVALLINKGSRTLSGPVPASWLVDLSLDCIEGEAA